MAAFKEWITGLIVFILFATILDLLLPSSKMGKYVRFVIKLLLIVIMLTPIFQIFSLDVEKTLQDVYFPSQEVNGQQQNLIENKKNEILEQQRAYILEQMAVQLKRQVNPGLIEKFGVEVERAEFEATFKDEQDLKSIDSLQVVLNSKETIEDGSIETIEPIEIGGSLPTLEPEVASNPAYEKIIDYLSDTLQIEKEKIQILEEGKGE